MYAKRSAWILTGIARAESGSDKQPRLADIDVAVQTEIPIPKQNKADTLWAVRGCGAQAVRTDLTSGREHPISLRPSLARTLEHGFGQVMRAFPGGRDILAAVDDEICRQLGSTDLARKVISFEDQYISTGGQLAELSYGHDRWIADLRPLVNNALVDRGLNPILCCHPYDICSALIARECGVIVTEIGGGTLQASLNIYEDVAWVGYANNDLRATVEPALNSALRQFGLL
jgi:hypothetical protein